MKKKQNILDSMGFKPVGMLITTQERKDEKGDPIFMTGAEIVQACKFQHSFKNQNTDISQFVTVIMHEDDQKEPNAFMISDIGLAMIRDGLCKEDPDNPSLLKVNQSPENHYQPAIVSEGKFIDQGDNFQPDLMLVQVIPSMPINRISKFQFVDVYAYCDKNNIFPALLDSKILTTMLRNPQRSKLPYHIRLSDFLLLLHLTEFIDEDLVCIVPYFTPFSILIWLNN